MERRCGCHFAGNQIPISMQDPVALNVMKYYPGSRHSDGLPFTHANNFFAQGVNVSDSNQMDIKLDHNISEKQRFMSRYSVNWGSSTPPLIARQSCR